MSSWKISQQLPLLVSICMLSQNQSGPIKKRGELVDGCVERVGELVLEIGKWIEYLV